MSTDSASSILFTPAQIGELVLSNRVVMAPLTRSRAHYDGRVKAMHGVYYGQRADAGLIISESTWIAPTGRGFAWTPGIADAAHVEAWKPVTEAVHAKDGRIFNQLWHVGRCSHPDLLPDGELPVAPSALDSGIQVFTRNGFKPAPVPRALETAELPQIVEQFRNAAQNAKLAGFDGVEIHGANGYLIDEFLCDEANRREDEYGGSIENRIRLPLEIVDAVVDVWGASQVGIRLSPTSFIKNCGDSDARSLFTQLTQELSARGLAYIHVIEGTIYAERDSMEFKAWELKQHFDGAYIGNNGYTQALAQERIAAGLTDLVSFGRPFIGNPDLIARFKAGAPIIEAEKDIYYGGDERGFTDFATL